VPTMRAQTNETDRRLKGVLLDGTDDA